MKINFEGKGTLKVIDSQYYPEFGRSIDNKHLIYDYNSQLPSKITIKISWQKQLSKKVYFNELLLLSNYFVI